METKQTKKFEVVGSNGSGCFVQGASEADVILDALVAVEISEAPGECEAIVAALVNYA